MKILLDENLPHELRPLLMPLHTVFTVAYLGWSAFENGELLAKAAAEQFDVLVTKDQGMEYQHNLTALPLAIVILRAKTNRIDDIRPLLPQLIAALDTLQPKSLVTVG